MPVEKPRSDSARSDSPLAIQASGLRKAYGDHVVLDGIDLDVAEGSCSRLLGANGAGKTTTCTSSRPSSPPTAATLRVAGHDRSTEPDAVRAAIGVTGQFSAVDGLLTGEENLRLMADLHHLGAAEARRRRDELLDAFDLVDAAGEAASTYSGGMRRRLDLAMTLVGDPRIIFLDEPTTGLDPRSRRAMWDDHPRARRRRRDDLPHDAVPRGGGPARRPDRGARPRPDRRRGHAGRAEAAGAAAGTSGCSSPSRRSSTRPRGAARRGARDDEALALQVPSDGGVDSLRGVLDRLDDAASTSSGLAVHTPDLDDVFLALTGTRARGDRHDHATPLVSDSATMLRRNLRHMRRYPSLTLLRRRHAGRAPAAVRVRLRRHARRRTRRGRRRAPTTSTTSLPGILLIAVAGAAQGTAIAVAMDMTEGIVARFRTMAIPARRC